MKLLINVDVTLKRFIKIVFRQQIHPFPPTVLLARTYLVCWGRKEGVVTYVNN